MNNSGEESSNSSDCSNKKISFNVDVLENNRKLPASRDELIQLAEKTFCVTGKPAGNISLVVCDDPFIEHLNITYKKRKGPTDVLSFPVSEKESHPGGTRELGDIIISLDTASHQASELGHSVKEEFMLLYVHGLLHILGYNHKNRREERVMFDLTNKILAGVWKF